jgi:mannose-6-phosphate isomerase-like protein (cupin superfamily)
MATAGEVVQLPGGERIVFVKTAADTGGEVLKLEAHYRPGRRPPPEHYHPHQEERFTGTQGTVTARIGGSERTLAPGDEVVVPSGVKHTFWNAGTEEARLGWEVRPALATEDFFEQLGAARSLLASALIVRRHPDEFQLASRLHRILLRTLAALEKLSRH